MCDDFRSSMMLEFDMFDLRRMRYFLGVEILQNTHRTFMC